MDIRAFPPDVLALTLSMLSGPSIINLLCTSKQVHNCVHSVQGAICAQSVLNDIADELPQAVDDCTALMETGVDSLQICGKPYTTEHDIHMGRGPTKSTFKYNRDAFISIIVPTTLQSVSIVLGGYRVISLHQPLLQAMESADGNIDLMAFLKHFPLNPWHDVSVWHHAEQAPATLTVIRAPVKEVDSAMRWRFLQIDQVLYDRVLEAGATTFRFQSNMASLGHIIVITHKGREVTDIVRSFTFSFGDRRWEIPGCAAMGSRIPERLFNCPVKLRNCYFLPLWSKVDCSRLPWLKLEFDFNRPLDGWIGVYNLRPNSAFAWGVHFGVTFT